LSIAVAAAGKATTVKVTDRATKREIVRDLEAEGYRVERVEKRKLGGWVWWRSTATLESPGPAARRPPRGRRSGPP
jgi:hypothetical protein